MKTYNCGCTGEVPDHMGRGAAREKRIAKWFARTCLDCRIARQPAFVGTLTNLHTQMDKDEALARALAHVRLMWAKGI